MVNEKKVAIVGCGFVGSSSAFALMQSGLFSEMVLIDVDKNRAEGEALDIAHGMTFAEPMKIYAGDYSDVADAAMIVVTAGRCPRSPVRPVWTWSTRTSASSSPLFPRLRSPASTAFCSSSPTRSMF